MILGAMRIPRVVEESICRISEDYYMQKVGDYKIHSTSLMPNIAFGLASIIPNSINKSIFMNADETTLTFASQISTQNYLTTYFVGSAPLEYYGPKTKFGKKFELVCMNGDPSYPTRKFGTVNAIRSNMQRGEYYDRT